MPKSPDPIRRLIIALVVTHAFVYVSAASWPAAVEVRMIALPQSKALALLPELHDPDRADAAVAQLDRLTEQGVARVVSWNQMLATADETREHRSGLEYREPSTWIPGAAFDLARLAPLAFETRSVGTMLAAAAKVEHAGDSIALKVEAQRAVMSGTKEWSSRYLERGLVPVLPQASFRTLRTSTAIQLATGAWRLFAVHRSPERADQMELWLVAAHAVLLHAGALSTVPKERARVRVEFQLIALPHQRFRPLLAAFHDPDQCESASAALLKMVQRRQAIQVASATASLRFTEPGALHPAKEVRYPSVFDYPTGETGEVDWGRRPKARHLVPSVSEEERKIGLESALTAAIEPDRQTIRVVAESSFTRLLRMRDLVTGRAKNGARACVPVPDIWSARLSTDVLVGNDRHALLGFYDAPERPGWIEVWLLKAKIISGPRD